MLLLGSGVVVLIVVDVEAGVSVDETVVLDVVLVGVVSGAVVLLVIDVVVVVDVVL